MTVTRRAMSLLELVLALAITAVLMLGMGAAIGVASRALPTKPDALGARQHAATVLDELATNLRVATQFDADFDATSVEFFVPDRDNDGVFESLQYAWSGTPGDPLTVVVNGGAPIVLAEDVHHFDLAYQSTVIAGTGGVDTAGGARLTVLFVVRRADNLHAEELYRKFLIESLGHDVQLLSEEAPSSEWSDAIAACQVAYISERANKADASAPLVTAPIGILTEHGDTTDLLDLTERSMSSSAVTSILIDDNTHYITRPFFPGLLPIYSDNEPVLHTNGDPIASGAASLASEPGRTDRAVLIVVETGAPLFSGAPAPARRVILPWGNGNDLSLLTPSGRTILERAFEWAGDAERAEAVESPLFSQLPDAGANDKDHRLKWDNWAVASIVPDLPDDAVGWKITRFRFFGRQHEDADRTLVAQVRSRDDAGAPTDDILDQIYFDEADLPLSYDWVELEFDLPTWIPSDKGVCVAIGMLSGDSGGDVFFEEGMGTATPANQFYKGSPGDWDSNDNRDIPCEIDGAVQMPLE
ncbi:MAG: hypothetical protein HKO59_10575 [Phycisphaerales bacterium]|nr:hypothetical protein [Phycisphaerae bacterium]NNM26407.1 hypothetical protein [Phycisphaerales bacterium]